MAAIKRSARSAALARVPLAQGLVEAARRAWPLLLPLVLLLPGLTSFPYPSAQAAYSDLSLTHYPNALFLKEALVRDHALPLWSPGILSGAPFAANPLSGLWYPPGWLALLLPLPFGFNILVGLHLLWGGLGACLFLKLQNLDWRAALLGGLAFEALPKLFAHYGAGHLTLLYAVPWTPWLLVAQVWQDLRLDPAQVSLGGGGQALDRLLQPGLVLGLIFLADPRWAAYAGGLWLAYLLFQRRSWSLVKTKAWFRQLLLAALLAAPLALPLVELTRLSTRAHLQAADVLAFSLPPGRSLGLLFPDWGGPHEWTLYIGQMILALSLLSLVGGSLRRRSSFWLAVLGGSWLYSLGSALPGMAFLAGLPGLDWLRVPSRALFLFGLAAAMLAAFSLDHLLKGASQDETRRSRLLLAGLAGFSLILALGMAALTGSLPGNIAWGAGLCLSSAIWIGLYLARRLPAGLWFAGLVGLLLLDLGWMDRSAFSPRPAAEVLSEGQETARWLGMRLERGRVYSPSYSLPQQTAASNHIELADGVDPLQLQSYVDFMAQATGVPATGYSVTLPPFASGDPARDNAAYLPNPRLLGLLNVRYVLAGFDLPVDGLVLRQQFGALRLYQNLKAQPRAWVQPPDAGAGQSEGVAQIVDWRPNRIEVRASGLLGQTSTRLVLSEIMYPGWQARVDGLPADLEAEAGILRSVQIGPGSHQVVFSFWPASLYSGLALGAVGLLLAFTWPGRQSSQPGAGAPAGAGPAAHGG